MAGACHRSGGVTTIIDTGILVNAYRRHRIEMVKDSSLGGPRTNVYIDGINVYSIDDDTGRTF